MKIRTLILVAALALSGMTVSLRAQDAASPSPGPALDSVGAPQGSALDSQGIRKYLLGPGDTISVRVWGQPDLSGDVDVDDEGNISELHFIDKAIPAQCRTEKEIAKDIATAYSKFLKNPQVSVRVTGRNSRQPASVFGAVRVPSRVLMQRRVRLQELITASGGVTEQANGDIQIMHTESAMCPQPGDEVEEVFAQDGSLMAPMKVYKMADLVAGKVASNPLIRPGDIVIVMEAKPIYITGFVTAPQGLYLQNGMTLSRAIAMVGGVRKDAKSEEIRIYRQKRGTSQQELIKVNFAAIKKKQAEDVLLEPYDIIDVAEAGMFSGKRIFPTLAQTLLGGGMGILTNGIGSVAYKVIY